MSRIDAIAKRFSEWSDGGTLPSPQHAKDVEWLLRENDRLENLSKAYLAIIGKREERIRQLMGQVESLEHALGENPL